MSMENRCMNNRPCGDLKTRNELDIAITKVSFAMDDTRLYLDTHPNCGEAIEYFKKLQMIRHQLIKEYTDRFGTIYSYNLGDSDSWNWNQGNFPWSSSKKGRC